MYTTVAASHPLQLDAPQQLGRYEIILPIAKGGMATVYLARASGVGGFDRYLALKLTAAHLRSDPEFAAHLIEEAKLVAHLRHTNVVSAYDVGECEHGIFLVMDYVPGDSFSGLRNAAAKAGKELPIAVSLRILSDALLGLHAAHEHEDEEGHPLHLVHRDFSPQNILVGTDGIARLTDFGIAKAASRISNTSAGFIKGKLSYLAPEQVHGHELDRRCDIWAAGVIAWEVLAGRRLAGKDDASAALSKTDPPRVKTVKSDVSDELDEVVANALRMDRDQRTSTAKRMGRALYTAAKTAGLLADHDEVAEHVVRLVGRELTDRKQRLAEARRERRPSVPDVRTLIGSGNNLTPKPRVAFPALPDVPIPVDLDDGASELRIQVPLDEPAHRADEALILGGQSKKDKKDDDDDVPSEDGLPVVYRSPVVAAPSSPSSSSAMPLEREEDSESPSLRRKTKTTTKKHDATTSPYERLRASVEPLSRDLLRRGRIFFSAPWTPRKLVVIGALGLLVGLVIVKSVLPAKPSSQEQGSGMIAGASSASASTSGSGVVAIVARPTTPTATAQPADKSNNETADAATLKINANAPIAFVRVADRLIEAVVPAPSVSVELLDEERDQPLRITVTATDGRIATATNEPGGSEIEVIFGGKASAVAASAATRTMAPAKRPDPDRAWPKRGIK